MGSKRWIVALIFLGCQTSLFSQDQFTLQDARDLFKESHQRHGEQKYEEAIQGFKKIYEHFPEVDPGPVSAYNIACGYSLLGKKTDAIEWLRKAIDAGFGNIQHMMKDTDLDNIRQEEGYLKVVKAVEDAPLNGKTTEDCARLWEKNLKRRIEKMEKTEREAFVSLLGKLETATVLVIIRNDAEQTSAGSGTIVKTEKGNIFVVTCGHNFRLRGTVVDHEHFPQIRLRDGRTFKINVLKESFSPERGEFLPSNLNDDAVTDLAIAQILDAPGDLPFLRVAKDVSEGERAYCLGYGGYFGRLQGKEIGNIGRAFVNLAGNRDDREKKLTALTNIGAIARVTSKHIVFSPTGALRLPPVVGNSGGPIFNARGELVGVLITSLQRTDLPEAGCTGLTMIKSFLEEVERQPTPDKKNAKE